jgi:hypothetical protein
VNDRLPTLGVVITNAQVGSVDKRASEINGGERPM